MTTLKSINPVMMILGLTLSGAALGDIEEWQTKQLFEPPQYLLLAEAGGRVTIYDGMPIEVVDRAMEEQFDRIDNMMFTGITYTGTDGEQVVEDDGC